MSEELRSIRGQVDDETAIYRKGRQSAHDDYAPVLAAADAVIGAARMDFSREGIASVTRLPGDLLDALAEAVNAVRRKE